MGFQKISWFRAFLPDLLIIFGVYIMSIFSYPDRGPWGKSNWRGNCSGHVYKELFERLQPNVFCDPMCGSNTSIEVANELNIEAYGLDLHSGFNILRDSILLTIGKEADLCLSHPPYNGCIVYSGQQWGDTPHPDDLSRCIDDEDFHQKLQVAMLNQREATKNGGIYGTIIGDWRRNGVYTSYQAEVIARMPANELAGVLIKAQHNTTSARKSYGKIDLPWITHEYILLFKKKKTTTIQLLKTLATEQAMRLRGTWKSIIRNVMISLGGKASLPEIYKYVSQNAPDQLQTNENWKAKVRQVLNSSGDYFSEERGIWALA